MLGISEDFIKLLVSNENRLIGLILDYAKKNGFTKFTSKSNELWRLSVLGMIESLILEIKTYGIAPLELHTSGNYLNDHSSAFGASEARKHHKKGVALNIFFGLLKYYRQSIFDLIEASNYENDVKNIYRLFIVNFFDRVEIGSITEWSELPVDNKLQELRHANHDISNKKNNYLAVFESFFAPLILLNEYCNITNFNLAASKLFSELHIGASICYNDKVSTPVLKELKEKINELISSSDEELCFETYLELNKRKRFFQVIIRKMLDESKKYKGATIIFDDLTHRKEIEQKLEISKAKAEEANKLKTAFLANMSHEIRTPMNAISGFTELLILRNPGEEQKLEFLKLIRKSNADLLHIIEDIIDITKIESDQLKIKYKTCRPYEIVGDLYAVFKGIFKSFGIEDDVELIVNVAEKDKDISFYTDNERLKQVLSNLLNNAAKFTSKGFIEFGYKIIDESNLFFFVRDTGPGIPQEMKEKIFDRFTQVEDTCLKIHQGAGLGLAICKNIVNLLGGKIWVESVVGKGSAFLFRLPLREATAKLRKPQVVKTEDELVDKLDWQNKHILVAEDDIVNFMLLNEILKKTNAKIYWAKNGLEAISIAKAEEKLDLVLMDIKMPEIDGLEAARYISDIRPGLPIIAQTALAMNGDKAKCLNAGCCAYVVKPVDLHKLFPLMGKYLSDSSRIKKRSHTFGQA
jgi:signal transduction histidine kinase/ActR/RegA family two-component response regulator